MLRNTDHKKGRVSRTAYFDLWDALEREGCTMDERLGDLKSLPPSPFDDPHPVW